MVETADIRQGHLCRYRYRPSRRSRSGLCRVIRRAYRDKDWRTNLHAGLSPTCVYLPHPLFPLHFNPTLAFVDMDSVHFYRPPNKTRRPDKSRSAASNFECRNVNKERDNTMTYGPSSSQGGKPGNYGLIEYSDLTASPPEDSFHPSLASVLDPKSVESHAGGTSRHLQV